METKHDTSRTFYEREVARSIVQEIVLLSGLVGKCYVMPTTKYHGYKPEGIKEQDIFVCEWNYDPKNYSWEYLKYADMWPLSQGLKMSERSRPLEVKKIGRAQMKRQNEVKEKGEQLCKRVKRETEDEGGKRKEHNMKIENVERNDSSEHIGDTSESGSNIIPECVTLKQTLSNSIENNTSVDVMNRSFSNRENIEQSKKLELVVVETNKGKMEFNSRTLRSVQYKGNEYYTGDFVRMLRPDAGKIHKIQRIEKLIEKDGMKYIVARRFYRALVETKHDTSRTFYEREVARSCVQELVLLSGLVGKCYVMPAAKYLRYKPDGIQEQDIFVFEWNYDPRNHSWEIIGNRDLWTLSKGLKMNERPMPLEVKKMEKAQYLKRQSKNIQVKVTDKKRDVKENMSTLS